MCNTEAIPGFSHLLSNRIAERQSFFLRNGHRCISHLLPGASFHVKNFLDYWMTFQNLGCPRKLYFTTFPRIQEENFQALWILDPRNMIQERLCHENPRSWESPRPKVIVFHPISGILGKSQFLKILFHDEFLGPSVFCCSVILCSALASIPAIFLKEIEGPFKASFLAVIFLRNCNACTKGRHPLRYYACILQQIIVRRKKLCTRCRYGTGKWELFILDNFGIYRNIKRKFLLPS